MRQACRRAATLERASSADEPDWEAMAMNWSDAAVHLFTDRPTDWLIAVFKGLLVFFTYSLVTTTKDLRRSTDKLWEAGERQISVARSNTEALIRAENAYLSVAVTNDTVGKLAGLYGRWDKSDDMFDNEVETPNLAYSIRNFGRTPALLKEISNQIIIARTFPQPAQHVIRERMPEDLVVAPGESSEKLICQMEDTFTVGDAVRFQNRESTFWFYGYLRFDDAFDLLDQLNVALVPAGI
jgi:hypothetical protein